MHAYETSTYEVHAGEIYARKMHTQEMHAHEIPAYEMHTPVLNSGKYTGCRSQIAKSPDVLNRPLAETSILAAAAPQPGGFPNNPIANFGVTCQRTLSGRQFHFCQHIPAEVVAFCKKLAYVLLQVTHDKGHRG